MANLFDDENIQSAIDLSHSLEYIFDYVPAEDSDNLLKVLKKILHIKELDEIYDELSYILLELITNANKAGAKKVFFHLKEGEIHDDAHYRELLPEFSRAIRAGFDPYIPYFPRLGLKTIVRFEFEKSILWIKVINNRSATSQEVRNIQSVIDAVNQIRNTMDAFEKMVDQTEGANLGTLTTLLLLRRMGLSEDDYQFTNDPKHEQTIVSLRVRLDTVTNQQVDRIADDIAASIENLPAFPDNIIRLQQMIVDHDVDIRKIARIFQSDPALTVELLRTVNSAQYMLRQKVSNITNALSLIGINGIINLLYSFGAQFVFYENFGRFSMLWDHASRTATYAYLLARELGASQHCDDVYLGGMLHDMGKILVYQLNAKLLPAIKEHCGGRIAGEILFEKLAVGAPHARIGAEIATVWNFPEFLIEIIRFHHTPLLAPDEVKKQTVIVYLADLFSYIGQDTYHFDSVQKEVLQYLNMDQDRLIQLEARIRQIYLDKKE